MNDESNGESTFEFVEKRIEDVSVSSDPTKTESTSSLSSLTSSLTPMAVSTSIGNLLSNIAPPSALPSFVANPVSTTPAQKRNENEVKEQSDDQTKQQTIESQQSVSAQSEEKEPEPSSSPENQFYDTGIVSGALFSWVKDNVVNSNVLSKVAEKAKSSVHSMMTTLDPQMREFIYSGGDCEVIVASNEEIKVSPVREAFQSIFGKATVTGVDVDTSGIPKTPIGFAAGVNAAEQRIKFVRNELSIPKEIPIVAVQSFILEVDERKWFELAAILLEDAKNEINLQMFSQMTPVPSQFVAMAQAETPADYPLKSSGLAISIGELMADNLQVPYNEWHHALTGVSRRDRLLLAAQSLAGIYKNTTTMV